MYPLCFHRNCTLVSNLFSHSHPIDYLLQLWYNSITSKCLALSTARNPSNQNKPCSSFTVHHIASIYVTGRHYDCDYPDILLFGHFNAAHLLALIHQTNANRNSGRTLISTHRSVVYQFGCERVRPNLTLDATWFMV